MQHLEEQARITKDIDLENYDLAVELVKQTGRVTTSFIQRKLRLGYNRAARIIGTMEYDGIVTEPDAKGMRTVIDT